jgi:hypothetical protein
MPARQDEPPFNATRNLPRTPPQRVSEPTAAEKHQPITLSTPLDHPGARANTENFLNELSPLPPPRFGTLAGNLMATVEECINGAMLGIQDIQTKAGDNRKTTVTIQRRDINAIRENLIKAKEALKEHVDKQQQGGNGDLEHRTSSMEADIREIKEAINAMNAAVNTKARTWAEVAAGGNKEDARVEMAKKERLEKARATRAKAEVTLTFQNATQETKDSLQNNADLQVQEEITKHIHSKTGLKAIRLRGIQRPTKLTVKLLCQNEEDAQKLGKLDWNELGGGRMIKTTYGVVIHGVAKTDINPNTQEQESMREALEVENSIKVARVATLTKREKNTEAPTHSIVVFTESPEEANNIIHDGLKTQDGRIHGAQRYVPQCQIKQCYRCQGYGHKATECTRPAKCGRCAGEHETRQCEAEESEPQCAQCKGKHPAWHRECPQRQNEQQRLKTLKDTIPPIFATII